MAHSAPASTFQANRLISRSTSGAAGLTPTPITNRVGCADRIAARVEPAVKSRDEIGQSDAVDIEDRGGLGIRPHLRRIARDDEQVANTRGRGTEQIRKHAQQVPVAAGVVDNGFEPDLTLNHQRREQRAHAALCPRSVRNVDGVDPGGLELRGLIEHRRRIHALRRHDLHRREKPTFRQLAADA